MNPYTPPKTQVTTSRAKLASRELKPPALLAKLFSDSLVCHMVIYSLEYLSVMLQLLHYRYIKLALLVTFLLTILFFCLWLYRAMKNVLFHLRIPFNNMISPGWSVGWFFVPIAMFWKPYFVMKQIWILHRGNTPCTALIIWWVSWLFAIAFTILYLATPLSSPGTIKTLYFGGILLRWVAGLSLMFMVKIITRTQIKLMFSC